MSHKQVQQAKLEEIQNARESGTYWFNTEHAAKRLGVTVETLTRLARLHYYVALAYAGIDKARDDIIAILPNGAEAMKLGRSWRFKLPTDS